MDAATDDGATFSYGLQSLRHQFSGGCEDDGGVERVLGEYTFNHERTMKNIRLFAQEVYPRIRHLAPQPLQPAVMMEAAK